MYSGKKWLLSLLDYPIYFIFPFFTNISFYKRKSSLLKESVTMIDIISTTAEESDQGKSHTFLKLITIEIIWNLKI